MPTDPYPMPDAVAALPRDAVGRPVPYTACWTHPGHDGPPLLPSPYGAIQGCACQPGEGTPLLGVLCHGRATRALLRRLCGTCGEPIAHDDTCYWPSVDDNPGYTEPPSHLECLAYALGICPALRAGRRSGKQDIVGAYGYGLTLSYPQGPDGVGLLLPENAPLDLLRSLAPATAVYCHPLQAVRHPVGQLLPDLT